MARARRGPTLAKRMLANTMASASTTRPSAIAVGADMPMFSVNRLASVVADVVPDSGSEFAAALVESLTYGPGAITGSWPAIVLGDDVAAGLVTGSTPVPGGSVNGAVVPGAGADDALPGGLAAVAEEAGLDEPDEAVAVAEAEAEADAEAEAEAEADGDGDVTVTCCPACGKKLIAGSVDALASAFRVSEEMDADEGIETSVWSWYGEGAPPGLPRVPTRHDELPEPLGQFVNVGMIPDASTESATHTDGRVPGPCVHTATSNWTVFPLVTLD
jgi:hypothetical protein